MQIDKVAMIGRGAIGTMFANLIQNEIGTEKFCFIADEDRCKRYEAEELYLNEKQCNFKYYSDSHQFGKVDLVIICVKYPKLKQSLENVKSFLKEDTIIISLLNGIVSEEIVEKTLMKGIVMHSIAQLMDSVKELNCVTYHNVGEIILGTNETGKEEYLNAVAMFLNRVNIPNQVVPNIIHKQWSKLMLNCGINQVCAVYDVPYGGCQSVCELREQFIQAMREVALVAKHEGVILSEDEINEWLIAVDHLDSEAMPSMRQDMLAKRYSEVDLFSKTIIELAKKHQIEVPINQYLYEQIKRKEEKY